MLINSFAIDRFGLLAEQEVADLSPGLNVFLGSNEAGKSTCLRFFRSMLFGYKRGNRSLDPMPLAGRALAGGSLALHGDTLGPLLLTRRPGAHGGQLSLSGPDGKSLSDTDLHALFGGMGAEVYDAVFAFSLKTLSDFSSLSGDKVRHALHGAAFGYVQSPATVLKILDERMKELLKEGKGQAAANLALRELDELRAELQARTPDLTAYAEARQRVLELEAGLAPLRQERDETRQALGRARRRLGLWQDWRELGESEAALAALPFDPDRPRPDPEAGPGLDALLARLEERRLALDEADQACLRLSAEHEALLAEAPDWEAPALLPLLRGLKEEKEARLAGAEQLPGLALERARLEEAQTEALALLGLDPGRPLPLPSLARREEMLQLGRELLLRGRALEESQSLCARLEEEMAEAAAADGASGLAGTAGPAGPGDSPPAGPPLPDAEGKNAVAAALITAKKALAALPLARSQLEAANEAALAARQAVQPQWNAADLLHFAAHENQAAALVRCGQDLAEALAVHERQKAREQDAARGSQEARQARALADAALQALAAAPGPDLLDERREQLRQHEGLDAALAAARTDMAALRARLAQATEALAAPGPSPAKEAARPGRLRLLSRKALFPTGLHLLLLGLSLSLGGLLGALPALLYSGLGLVFCALALFLIAPNCDLASQQACAQAAAGQDPLTALLLAVEDRCRSLETAQASLLAEMAGWLPQSDGQPDCAAAAALLRTWSLDLLRREEAQKAASLAGQALDAAKRDQAGALADLQEALAALERRRGAWRDALSALNLDPETAPGGVEALLQAARSAMLLGERAAEAAQSCAAALEEVRSCLRLAASEAWFATRLQASSDAAAALISWQAVAGAGPLPDKGPGQDAEQQPWPPEAEALAALELLSQALTDLAGQEAEQREQERLASVQAERDAARSRLVLRLERALAERDAARAEHERARLAWQEMLPGLGLDPALGPESANQALKELQAAAARARDLALLEERRAAIRQALAAFAAKVEDLARRAALPAPAAGPDSHASFEAEALTNPEAFAGPEAEAAFAAALPRLELLAERIERAAEKADLAGRVKGQLALKNGERERTLAAVQAAQAELTALLEASGCATAKELRAALVLAGQRQALETRRQTLLKNLGRAAEEEGIALAGFLASLQGASLNALAEEESALEARNRELEEGFGALSESLGRARQRLETLAGEEGTGMLRQREAQIKARLRAISRQWAVPALAREFLLRAKRRFEEEGHEGVIRFAGDIFADVTGGAYSGIAALEDGAFAAVNRAGERRDPESQLSRGTREQLYLALRLAYVQNHASRAESLPLIMDDILVNFDPERARAMAGVLAAFSGRNQLLFFTCHPDQAEMLVSAAGQKPCPLPRLFTVKRGRIDRQTI